MQWQLWLEAFSGVICTCIYANTRSAAAEGFAMAVQLCTMLQGKAQYRQMRHTVAEWARQLAPHSARPLLMKGEAVLDQPLSGQDEAEAVPLLRAALEIHKAALGGDGACPGAEEAAGEAADASLYWGVLSRALVETGLGKCDAEACEILREVTPLGGIETEGPTSPDDSADVPAGPLCDWAPDDPHPPAPLHGD